MLSDEKLRESKNFVPAVRDFLLGDVKLESLITDSELATLAKSLQIISQDFSQSKEQRVTALGNSWQLYDRVRSPTPEEFLTPEWIGPMGNDMLPHMREIFTEYWSPTADYHTLILAMAIGTQKSTLSVLSNLYITSHIWCKRNPKKFFGAVATTAFVQAFISFTIDKAKQTLFQPFIQLLQSSPKFHRVKQEELLDRKQKEYPNEICWTTSSRIGELQFWGDIHYPVAASPQNLLGLNMIAATMSEISFFVERGFSPDYIWRIFQDSKARVKSRFGTHRLATVILDSSPNDLEFSPIDRYIFTGEAAKDPTNYIRTGSQWQYRPDHDQYRQWRETGEVFKVFRGNGSESPMILTEHSDISKYDKMEIVDVPIDLFSIFREDLNRNVKNYMGWPAGNPDKLIREASYIERMFKPNLRNFYSSIHLPANRDPKHQLWDIVKRQFFLEVAPGRYEFYRAPKAERFMHFDQAETKDHAGISMVHMEWDPTTNEKVEVADFTIDIAPTVTRINLLAIMLFAEDLRNLGRVNLKVISFDMHQSSTAKQYLANKGFDVRPLSVDRDIKVYQALVASINAGRIKVGRNIVLKGNLRSLQEVKSESGHKKIEHTIGKVVKDDGGNWNSSLMGVNAKDATDSLAGATWWARMDSRSVPEYTWEEPTKEGQSMGDASSEMSHEDRLAQAKAKYLKMIQEKHGFIEKEE